MSYKKPFQPTRFTSKTKLPQLKKDDSESEKSDGKTSKTTASYLNNFTVSDIAKDKTNKRYHLLMSKLEEINIEKELPKDVNKYKPLPPSPVCASRSSSATKPSNSSFIKSSDDFKSLNNPSTSVEQAHKVNGNHENGHKEKLGSNEESSDDDDDDDDEADVSPPIKAPNELLEEFLVYVMEKKWTEAHKLCTFILMYEPNNRTAKEFLPLIETKLNTEESDESSEESSDSESTDDDDEDSDDDDEDDDSDDDESDSEDSTDAADNDEDEKDKKKKIKEKNTEKTNGSL